jgi:hypothetical protein
MANDVQRYDPETGEVMEVVETTSLAQQLTKAEIDQQVATAHRFPRSLQTVARGTLELATFSPAAAAECNYALPRGGKSLTGPSIRLAEIVVSQFGNCRVGARVVHVDRLEKYVEAEAVFHDLEKNSATTARVRRRIVDAKGRLYNDDMILVTGNAACSIAKRNAVLAAVPKALWMPAYDAALAVIKGDAKTLTERREGALKALGAFGVTPDMICGALEINGPLEISLDHMPTLIAWHKSLKDGEQTVESLFPAPAGAAPKDGKGAAPKGTADKLNDIANKGKAANEQSGKAASKSEGEQAQGEGGEGAAAPASGEGSNAGDAEPEDQGGSDGGGSGDSSGDEVEPDEEALDAAYQRGARARGQGRPRTAVPPDLKKTPPLAAAWERGWEAGPDDA